MKRVKKEIRLKISPFIILVFAVMSVVAFVCSDEIIVSIFVTIYNLCVIFQTLVYLKIVPAKKESWYLISIILWDFTLWMGLAQNIWCVFAVY